MRFVYLTHSLISCWNHGNAHFLRGILRELISRGHSVRALEPAGAWSRANLSAERDADPDRDFARHFPELSSREYAPTATDWDTQLAEADVVMVHEWTDPAVVAAVGRARRNRNFVLLFHDTHHRAATAPGAIAALELSAYDGVLAFGAALADIYRSRGWHDSVFIWHEAADVRLFKPPAEERPRAGLVWVGNWGDGERTAELAEYLLAPARECHLPLDIYGVRYPETAIERLAGYGARYYGWLANAEVPSVFARHLATVHVPRRIYRNILPGIPTIRLFEALACGIPLVCAPWEDTEHLFHPGQDYLVARTSTEMSAHLQALAHDPDLRRRMAVNGLAAIRARHTCAHRVDQLMDIIGRLRPAPPGRVGA